MVSSDEQVAEVGTNPISHCRCQRTDRQCGAVTMVKLFNRGWRAVTLTTDIVTDTVENMASVDNPIAHIPVVPVDQLGSLEDLNLPLLVREIGERKKQKLLKRMVELEREMEKAQKELHQLNVLLEAANTL